MLRFPLLYKLLIANVMIVAVGAAAGTFTTVALVRSDPSLPVMQLVILFALVAVGVSAVTNVVVLKLALSPVTDLEDAAKRVHHGDADARVPPSPFADHELQLLAQTFNDTLAELASYQRRLRVAAATAVRAAEVERKRIARELHDDTASMLAALLIRLRVARATTDSAARDHALDEVRDGLVEMIETIHGIARALRPAVLDEMGVVAAIEEQVRLLPKSPDLSIEMETEAIEGSLSPDAELALYRIVQEALANAVRHAQAQMVRVHVAPNLGGVHAVVSDDGRGFAVAEQMTGTERGLGLLGMQERAAYVGGHMEITSRLGSGTVVRVQIPRRETA